MKILVFGSNGMAGHIICKYLKRKNYEVDTVARSTAKFALDIENIQLTNEFLDKIKYNYDFIINCVGLLVKDSIDRPDRAALINSWFPHSIEKSIKDSHTKLIHLSTDCVFDGKDGPYIESDKHTEINFYGKSKALGEVNNNKDITLRMSIIGPEIKKDGTGLMNWILNTNEEILNGWEDSWWNGLTTLQLAKSIEQYINDPKIFGIYHLVNNDLKINKFDLLCKINQEYNLNKTIVKIKGPKYINKILIDTKQEFQFDIPNYDQQLKELREFK